jgi:outer membrane protein assembly factor BamD
LLFELHRTARVMCAVLVAGALSACASAPRAPAFGEAEADKFLFDRGTEFLAKKNWINAREYFRRLVDGYPRSTYREEAKLGIGDSFVGEGRIESLILGANEFREFLQFFPRSQRADYAQYRLGYSQFKQMLGPQRDQTATHDAIRELQRFLDSYPDSKYRSEVQKLLRDAKDRLGEHEFKIGQLYYRMNWNPGALNRFTELLRSDPEYARADEVLFYTAETMRRMNALAEALPIYDRIVKDFPTSEYKKDAEERLAEIKRSLGSGGAAPSPPPGSAAGS